MAAGSGAAKWLLGRGGPEIFLTVRGSRIVTDEADLGISGFPTIIAE